MIAASRGLSSRLFYRATDAERKIEKIRKLLNNPQHTWSTNDSNEPDVISGKRAMWVGPMMTETELIRAILDE